MNEFDFTKWQAWNLIGFFPGPSETESEFLERIQFCLNLQKHLVESSSTDFPFEISKHISDHSLLEVFPITEKLFGIHPDWVLLFFSNYHLAPWHGGCAWIFQLTETTPIAAFLQLRSAFKNKKSYLGLYQRSELIAHELCHVGRMMYEEPRFEEFFAYQTSTSRWRRFFGPIIQSSKETLFFIAALALIIFTDITLITAGSSPSLEKFSMGLKIFPIFLFLLAFVRLCYRKYQFHQSLANLQSLYPKEIASHLHYRLLDEEIALFSRLTPDEIKKFILSQKNFRWNFLSHIYGILFTKK